MRVGENLYSKATVTLSSGSTPVASYLLDGVKVRMAGNQTSISFEKLEFKFGSGVGANQGKFDYDIKNNKKV